MLNCLVISYSGIISDKEVVNIKKGISNVQIIIIALVAVVVGWGLIYFATKNAVGPNVPNSEEVSQAVEEAFESAREQGRAEFVEEEVNAYKAMLSQLSDLLSNEGKQNAELVLGFVEENPSVLYDTSVEVPEEIRQAYFSLTSEVEEIKQSVGYLPKSDVDANSPDVVDLTGVLQVSELSEQGIGTMFKITDENDGFNYYFILNQSETQRMSDENLLGSKVAVQVEITQRSEKGVLYKVLNGPNLAE